MSNDDSNTLVHIAVPEKNRNEVQKKINDALAKGMFDGYEFIVTENDASVTVADIDELADAVAERVNGDTDE